ncbi:MAG: hypothetical protein IJ619_01835 [Eubacterium sp.]|nr:hypothetical protein [Eubacterium sp.]
MQQIILRKEPTYAQNRITELKEQIQSTNTLLKEIRELISKGASTHPYLPELSAFEKTIAEETVALEKELNTYQQGYLEALEDIIRDYTLDSGGSHSMLEILQTLPTESLF